MAPAGGNLAIFICPSIHLYLFTGLSTWNFQLATSRFPLNHCNRLDHPAAVNCEVGTRSWNQYRDKNQYLTRIHPENMIIISLYSTLRVTFTPYVYGHVPRVYLSKFFLLAAERGREMGGRRKKVGRRTFSSSISLLLPT